MVIFHGAKIPAKKYKALSNMIKDRMSDDECHIIPAVYKDPTLLDECRVTIIAAGYDNDSPRDFDMSSDNMQNRMAQESVDVRYSSPVSNAVPANYLLRRGEQQELPETGNGKSSIPYLKNRYRN